MSYFINSLAIPIYPLIFLRSVSPKFFLPLTIVNGKNVALPILLSFKYFISFLAISSSLVIISDIAPPNAISIAVSNLFSTLIISPKTKQLFLSIDTFPFSYISH